MLKGVAHLSYKQLIVRMRYIFVHFVLQLCGEVKQDISSQWNSTLSMIQSILEQMMALAAYTAENVMPQLTANQLEIVRKLMLAFAPIEEITQVIFKQIVTLRSSRKKMDDESIQTMKEQMVHSLN